MLYYLCGLVEWLSPLRLFGYTTFRATLAFMVGFISALLFVRMVIQWMKRQKKAEPLRDFGGLPDLAKRHTPSMGGLAIVAATLLGGVLCCRPVVPAVIPAVALVLYGMLGGADDLLKLKHGSSEAGLPRAAKLIGQGGIAALLAVFLFATPFSPFLSRLSDEEVQRRRSEIVKRLREVPPAEQVVLLNKLRALDTPDMRTALFVPFVKDGLRIGILYFPLMVLFLWLTTNSVNLTDGMDGLAIVPGLFCVLVFGIFAYLVGHAEYYAYLFLPHIRDAGEAAVLCASFLGAGLAFLWYNAYPASIFMGDTGALAIGGFIGALALVVKQELLFVIAGGVFVLEIASVFIQDYIGLKVLGRRIFYRAPYHHNMLHKGVGESKVTIRLWIVAAILAMIALASIKIR